MKCDRGIKKGDIWYSPHNLFPKTSQKTSAYQRDAIIGTHRSFPSLPDTDISDNSNICVWDVLTCRYYAVKSVSEFNINKID